MRARTLVVVGLLLALVLAGGVSYYASSQPDGLNKVAADQGFNKGERGHDLEDSPLAGYETEGVDDGRVSGGVAGVVGVLITFLAVGGLAYAARRRGTTDEARQEDADSVSASS